MPHTTIARWEIEYDAVTTARCYQQIPVGSGCDCLDCRTFLKGAEHFFPPEFHRLADLLGIDCRKPAELLHYGVDPATGLHITGGWFTLAGSIVSGADLVQWTGSSGTYHFEPLTATFQLGFSAQAELIAEPFRPHSVIQLEFSTQVGWELAEPYSP